jgi:hypothetical protein
MRKCMPKDDMELEEFPRSFRVEKALGRVIDKYSEAWERSQAFVIKLCLREKFHAELPSSLQPTATVKKQNKANYVQWGGSDDLRKSK